MPGKKSQLGRMGPISKFDIPNIQTLHLRSCSKNENCVPRVTKAQPRWTTLMKGFVPWSVTPHFLMKGGGALVIRGDGYMNMYIWIYIERGREREFWLCRKSRGSWDWRQDIWFAALPAKFQFAMISSMLQQMLVSFQKNIKTNVTRSMYLFIYRSHIRPHLSST